MSTEEINIRPYEERDLGAVSALWSEVFGYPDARNDPARVIADKIAVQPELLFVAEEGRTLIGTVMAGYDGHRGWIYRLAVTPERRKNGYGAALMKHAVAALKDLGCLKVNLQILGGKDETVAFYERLGFKVEPRISMGIDISGLEAD